MFKRVVTGIIMAVIVLVVLFFAPLWLFKILNLALIAAALNEFYRLVFDHDMFARVTGVFFSLLFAAFMIYFSGLFSIVPLLIGLSFILTIAHMTYYTAVEGATKRIGLILFGTIYLSFTLSLLSWIQGNNIGAFLIIFTIATVTMGDTFAMFTGKAIGRHKLSPLISPNKTIEGLIASFVGGVLAGFVCWYLFFQDINVVTILVLSFFVALAGVLGDLVESLIKRDYHVKDSGTILPGHGGILDRIDAMIFALPLVFFVMKYLEVIK